MSEIDWSSLSFGYMKTDYNVRCYYRNGAWGEIETCSEETIPLHMAATCLHYGQEAFEGLPSPAASNICSYKFYFNTYENIKSFTINL